MNPVTQKELDSFYLEAAKAMLAIAAIICTLGFIKRYRRFSRISA